MYRKMFYRGIKSSKKRQEAVRSWKSSKKRGTDALVFMSVLVNSNRKKPCGYSLVNDLTVAKKAELTKNYTSTKQG